MKLTISRASDHFMECDHPNPDWSPCKQAKWDNNIKNWVIELESPKQIAELFTSDDVKITITKLDELFHAEIDDIGKELEPVPPVLS